MRRGRPAWPSGRNSIHPMKRGRSSRIFMITGRLASSNAVTVSLSASLPSGRPARPIKARTAVSPGSTSGSSPYSST